MANASTTADRAGADVCAGRGRDGTILGWHAINGLEHVALPLGQHILINCRFWPRALRRKRQLMCVTIRQFIICVFAIEGWLELRNSYCFLGIKSSWCMDGTGPQP